MVDFVQLEQGFVQLLDEGRLLLANLVDLAIDLILHSQLLRPLTPDETISESIIWLLLLWLDVGHQSC